LFELFVREKPAWVVDAFFLFSRLQLRYNRNYQAAQSPLQNQIEKLHWYYVVVTSSYKFSFTFNLSAVRESISASVHAKHARWPVQCTLYKFMLIAWVRLQLVWVLLALQQGLLHMSVDACLCACILEAVDVS